MSPTPALNTKEKLFNPAQLIVALDVDTQAQAENLVAALSPLGVTFKVGLQLFFQQGMAFVQQLQAQGGGVVFVDLKLHDIPNTVGHASAALVRQGVRYFNVHAQGGPDMMRAAIVNATQAASGDAVTVLGVTLLTSIAPSVLTEALCVHKTPQQYVLHLAQQAQQAGLSGVVCSAQEAPVLRQALGPDFLLVTPGIRPSDSDLGDQHRIVTPAQAMLNGASAIVVGRPITASPNPVDTVKQLLAEMKTALSRV
jgi:orotidine-5'-phosphate decarboxylase